MEATGFSESNLALSKPEDMTHDQCDSLEVWRGNDQAGQPVIISCWKLTQEELEEFVRTKRIWLIVFGSGMPPVALTTKNPFV